MPKFSGWLSLLIVRNDEIQADKYVFRIHVLSRKSSDWFWRLKTGFDGYIQRAPTPTSDIPWTIDSVFCWIFYS